MNSVILISAPAAGKGTISKYIEKKYDMNHISTGDLLRNEVSKETELGLEISELINKGALISDDMLLDLLEKKISRHKKDYVLDGAPRTLNQAKKYDEILNKYNANLLCVIHIETEKEILEKRITGRLICKSCNSIYNKYVDDVSDNKCPKCQNKLSKRKDDSVEVFNSRYETYKKETRPLQDYYKKKGILYTITNNGDIKDAYKQIDDIFLNITGVSKNGKE